MKNGTIKTLYVIGNGFDLYHGLNSSFKNYREWLEKNHQDIYKNLIELYGDEAKQATWWGNFEENLGYMSDVREHIENIADAYEPTGKDFYDPEEGGRDTDNELRSFVDSLKSTFAEWVCNLDKPHGEKVKFETRECVYISFNYTRTLEDYYKIPCDCIYHVHGDIENQVFILGHGRGEGEIIDDTAAPIAPWNGTCSPSEYGLDGIDNENYANVRKAFIDNIMSIRKDVDGIISQYKEVFDSLSDVQNVVFIGISFSSVDIPYIKKIIESVSEHASFSATYYTDEDKEAIARVSDKFKCLRIEELTEQWDDLQILFSS